MKNGIEIAAGHFAKVICDGKVIARAYAQADGTWRVSIAGNPEGAIVSAEMVPGWLAMQSLVG